MRDKKLLIISDIHGNYEGLRKVLGKIRSGKYQKVICLGDVVGYGADPEKCLEALAGNNIVILKGNHEAMLCGELSDDKCSGMGKLSALWTRERMRQCAGADAEKAVSSFPDLFIYNDMLFCHTSGYEEDFCGEREEHRKWPYLNSVESVRDAFAQTKESLVFYGHTHRMRYTKISGTGTVLEDRFILKSGKISVKKMDGNRHLINAGSVGQQRDGRTDCGYVEVTEKETEYVIRFIRKKYPDFISYYKIRTFGCGRETASYLIREGRKKKRYDFLWRLLNNPQED